mgnify:CR=1 FL=1
MKAFARFIIAVAIISFLAIPCEAGRRGHHHHRGHEGDHYTYSFPVWPFFIPGPSSSPVFHGGGYSPQGGLPPCPYRDCSYVDRQAMVADGYRSPGVSGGPTVIYLRESGNLQVQEKQLPGPQLVQSPREPRLKQVAVGTATLIKKAKILHIYGKPMYPELRPGEAMVVCNAENGFYKTESGDGHSYHAQQCWRYDNPVGGEPVEEEVFK